MITLKSMRYFTTTVRLGSITRAADELHVAASAIAAAIDQIEAHFQLTLVTRQRAKGVSATADGKILTQRFVTLLEDYDSVLAAGAELKQGFSGTLRIGYYAPIAPAFLPKILSSLIAPEHSLTLQLEECDNIAAQVGLRDGQYDVILFVADATEPWMQVYPLIEAPAYCLLPATHHLADTCNVRLQDLVNEPIVVLDRPMAREYYQRLFDLAGQHPRVLGTANATEMVRSLVGTGQACAILNMVPQSDTTYAGDRVVARPLADDLPPLTLSVGYIKPNTRRVVDAFVGACRAFFDGPEGQATVCRRSNT